VPESLTAEMDDRQALSAGLSARCRARRGERRGRAAGDASDSSTPSVLRTFSETPVRA
jgi:hypothetical protein